MAILDDPTLYYGSSQDDWALGDVVIVPSVVLWRAGERPTEAAPQPTPPPDGSASIRYALWTGGSPFPDPMIEAWLTPAVIVVDDCVIDKEFNASVEQRIRSGIPEDQAVEAARSDKTLDPLVPIAPILPYEQLRSANEQAVRQAQSVGYFPVVESAEMDEGYIDFTRTVPVSRHLLTGPFASMSDPARRVLRWKLAQFYAFRNQSIDEQIMDAVGKTITNVNVVTDHKNRLVVELELDTGASSLRLRQEPRQSEAPPGHERGR